MWSYLDLFFIVKTPGSQGARDDDQILANYDVPACTRAAGKRKGLNAASKAKVANDTYYPIAKHLMYNSVDNGGRVQLSR